jgi:hypothetical protein
MESRNVWQMIRDFLFSKANREFLIFMFFLALSGFFWLFLALNESYEKEFAIPVTITDVPKNIMLTSEETDTVKVTIRDKGTTLITYMYGKALPQVRVNYKHYARNDGTGTIPMGELQKFIRQQLASSSKITNFKPDKLVFYYNFGDKKRVPVRWSGRVIPEQLFFISRVEYQPDSVTIYAPKEKLDSINMIYTEQLNYVNFRDTLQVTCRLMKQTGVKMVPEDISIRFFTDVLTEESMNGVPIQGINMPPGKVLRTFPAKVRVRFVTGANVFRNLRPEDFTVVADYNELASNPSEKCHIYLKDSPQGISRARLDITHVDYLIEEEEPR